MAEVDGVSRRAVPRQLKAAPNTAGRMAAANGARRRAVPRLLKAVAHFTAWRTAEASATGRMTASS